MDDGSTDGTADALGSYEARSNVKVLYCKHKGASATRETEFPKALERAFRVGARIDR